MCLLTVRIPAMFAIMPFPVLRSMMSKVVSKSEQGEWLSENHCSKAKLLIQQAVGHKSSPLLKSVFLCDCALYRDPFEVVLHFKEFNFFYYYYCWHFHPVCMHSSFWKDNHIRPFFVYPLCPQERFLPVWLLQKT